MSCRKLFLLLVVVLTSATFVAAASISDVEHKIADKAKVERLQVQAENGKVILEGLAWTLWDKTQAGKIASKELKVPVVNNIGLKSTMKSDRELSLDVSSRIHTASTNDYLFNLLSVDTRNSEVILQGKLRDAYLKDVAVKAAMQTPGVRGVVDRIELLPVSPSDDRLRVAIFERLRRDGRLSSYFLSPHPAINIIVESSRVTLIGYVNSEVDRVKAGMIARETSGVLSVNNQLQVG